MRKKFNFSLDLIKPASTEVMRFQGMAPGAVPSEKVKDLFDLALKDFVDLAEPAGMLSDISSPEFSAIYKGNDQNENNTPLEGIFPKADFLALFAFTLGINISSKIEMLFKENEFPLAAMLDAVASQGAERAITIAESMFLEYLLEKGETINSKAALLYSPGYCGWHISGQKKLFEYLQPEDIGISLNSSFLMIPLKSVSGVLVAGDNEIHVFSSNYPFCIQCKNKTCKQRINMVKNKRTED